MSAPIILCKFFPLTLHARQNTFVIEMQGPERNVKLTFTKDHLMAASVQEQSFDFKYGGRTFTVKYRIRRVKTGSGSYNVLFPSQCKGKHDPNFISVGN